MQRGHEDKIVLQRGQSVVYKHYLKIVYLVKRVIWTDKFY